MPTTVSQSANFRDIATAIRDRIVAVTNLDAAFVVVVSDDAWQLASVERCIYVRVFGITPDTDAGAGRRARPVYRRMRTYLYSRDARDSWSDNIIALFGDESHDVFEGQVINGLDEWVPVDGSGTALVIEPIHFVDSEGGPPLRKPDDGSGMLRSHFDWQIRYVLPNTTPTP